MKNSQVSLFVLVASLVSACGADKISSYKEPGGGLVRLPPAAPVDEPQASLDDDDAQALSVIRDESFDTGLTPCVKEALVGQGKDIFAPPVIRASTALLTQTKLESNTAFFELYDLLLREFVTPGEGLVAYSRLREGGDLRNLWLRLRDFLPELDLAGLDSDSKRIAFWVNLYNIVMIDILVEDPNALSFVGRLRTFSQVKRNVAGFNLTLDTIEYGILGLGEKTVDNPIPESAQPTFAERRLHVGLVCGAISCPKLRNFAYEAASLELILEENAHMFFNDTGKHFVRQLDGSFKVSSLFNWFSKDFDVFAGVQTPGELSRYFLGTCRKDIEEAGAFLNGVESFSKLPRDNILGYDWSPNELK